MGPTLILIQYDNDPGCPLTVHWYYCITFNIVLYLMQILSEFLFCIFFINFNYLLLYYIMCLIFGRHYNNVLSSNTLPLSLLTYCLLVHQRIHSVSNLGERDGCIYFYFNITIIYAWILNESCTSPGLQGHVHSAARSWLSLSRIYQCKNKKCWVLFVLLVCKGTKIKVYHRSIKNIHFLDFFLSWNVWSCLFRQQVCKYGFKTNGTSLKSKRRGYQCCKLRYIVLGSDKRLQGGLKLGKHK